MDKTIYVLQDTRTRELVTHKKNGTVFSASDIGFPAQVIQ